MKQLFTSRKICVLRHGSSLFALSPNKSVLLASSVARFATFSPSNSTFRTRRLIYCAPPHSSGASPRQPLPTFNFHRARVRRASGLLQVALPKARQTTLLLSYPSRKRASDKALRLPVTNLANFLEAQVAMISPWIRKIKDTLTRTCWRLRCCINRIPSDPGADLLSCTVNLIGDSGHNSGQGCRIGFRLLMQSFRPCQTVQS